MKQLLLPLLAALVFPMLPAALPVSAAESGYAVVLTEDTWFYASPGEPLFLLPYTYCVRVVEEGEEYCAVEYGENGENSCVIAGYCRREKLHFLDFVPENAFLKKQVTVTYEAPLPPSPFGEDLFRKAEATFGYYGARYAEGECYLYVYGKDPVSGQAGFAYLKGEIPAFGLNEQYLPASAPAAGGSVQSSGGLTPAHIVVIVIGCLAVVVLAVLLLRGKTAPREEVSDF